MEDSFLGILHDDHYSEYNYYGSQVYVPAASPGPSGSTVQFVHPCANPPNTHPYANRPSTCTSYGADQIESSQDEDPRADERGKGPRKQAAKYDSLEPGEDRYLVNNFHVIGTLWLTNIFLLFSAPKIDKLKIWQRQILLVQCVRT